MNEKASNRVLSGFRPTSDLTLGNYFGAIKPALEIQDDETKDLSVFVADLHGLTDHGPEEIAPYTRDVIRDCLALGIDPDKTHLYLQSSIEAPVTQIANRVSPYVSVAELSRTPNLKEKMQKILKDKELGDYASRSNLSLLSYPVLMAADIYSQDSDLVAVGEDQEPHLEIARTIARRFNRKFSSPDAPILVEPQILAVQGLRILSLDGKGKMSKTNAKQAILLTDDPDEARSKISRATTAQAGEWNKVIDSHFTVASNLADDKERNEFDEIKSRHLSGEAIMGVFKREWANVTERHLVNFQERKAALSDKEVSAALKKGAVNALVQSERVLDRMREGMGM